MTPQGRNPAICWDSWAGHVRHGHSRGNRSHRSQIRSCRSLQIISIYAAGSVLRAGAGTTGLSLPVRLAQHLSFDATAYRVPIARQCLVEIAALPPGTDQPVPWPEYAVL